MRSSSRADIAFVGAVGLVFAASALGLFLDSRASSRALRSGGGDQVGTIVYRQHRAERKYTGQVIWGGLAQNGPVFDLDAIRTASESSATIFLEDSTRIDLDEQTLILIKVREKRIDLGGGTLQLSRGVDGKASGEMTLAGSTGAVKLGSGSVFVSDDGSKVSVAVSSGQATLESGGASQVVAQSQSASVGADGAAAPIELVPVSPGQGIELMIADSRASQEFRWIAPEGFVGELVLSLDRDFAKVASRVPVEGSSGTAAIAPGTWYWRIESGGRSSKTRRFTLRQALAPEPIKPDMAVIAASKSAKPLIDLSWKPSPNASAYRVELSPDESFSTTTAVLRTSGTSISTDLLPQGKYFWRAVALYPSFGIESPSRTATFTVASLSTESLQWRGGSAATEGSGAAASFKVSSAAAAKGGFTLSWDPTEYADSYRVTVARDEAFKDVVLVQDTSSNFVRIERPLDEGLYYINLRASVGGELTQATPARQLLVSKPVPLRILQPKPEAVLDPEDRDLDLRWADENGGAESYRAEFARDELFADIVVRADSPKTAASISLPADLSGSLYWRVTALGAGGASIAASPNARIVMPRSLPVPTAIGPKDGFAVDLYVQDRIAFSWKPVPGANEYGVSLYRTGAGAGEALKEWSAKGTVFELRSFDFLAPDAYAWKLVAFDRRGGTILGKSPVATQYFRIIQSSALATPELELIGDIFVH
jgi:hypothetical protein